ncbi:MAG TPA: DinB family protein [Anaerolineales bacterium]|nr:DinB family protein [Anaerolineales bacterium]
MNQSLSKHQLLESLRTSRAQWDSLLASVGEERMTQPGVTGNWSVKDIVSHVTAYECWLVEWLTAAEQNTFPAPSPLDDADVARRNARVYEMTHARSLHDVMTDAQQNFEALLNIIETLHDEYFSNPQSTEWFMKPYWNTMNTIPDAVINLSVDHYDEHIPSIKAWIEKSKEK